VAGTCECGNQPSGSMNFLTSRKPVSFSRKTLLDGISKYTPKKIRIRLLLRLCYGFSSLVLICQSHPYAFESL